MDSVDAVTGSLAVRFHPHEPAFRLTGVAVRSARGFMDVFGDGLRQENQKFGVDVRDPERHDQHCVPAVCRMGH